MTLAKKSVIRKEIEDLFRELAKQNAWHDKQIFTRLFVNLKNRGDEGRRDEIHAAIEEAKNNILDILNITQEIFSRVTGDQCGVCVQIIERINGVEKRGALIKTLIRDVGSAAIRTDPSVGHAVDDNTIHKRIFVDDEPIVYIDDLAEARAKGNFDTSSKNWSKYYNAVLVAAIPPMQEASMPRATLCIDNMKGGLADPFCQTLASQLVWRLAVKLYRLDEMVKSLE